MALFAEGPTDYAFLPPILRRATESICLSPRAKGVVDLGDVLPLDSPPQFRDCSRETKIFEAANAAHGAFSLLFVHADGNGDPDGARANQVGPGITKVEAELMETAGVAVVPVREIEAWALVDGDALRVVFGASTVTDDALGVPPRPREVESILDPKRVLDEALRAVIGRDCRRSRGASRFLGPIAERVRLGILHTVPSFAAFEDELAAALARLGFIDAE